MERLTRRDKVDGNEFVRINKGAPDFVVYEKLADYEDLEEQNRLLKLPCEIGQRVYMIYQFCGKGAWEIEEHKIRLEDLENIGKTVFLTREEAEAALKELERGKGND